MAFWGGLYIIWDVRFIDIVLVKLVLQAINQSIIHSVSQSIILGLWPFFQVHLGEPVLSQRRYLLEQLLDFHEPVVLPVTQPVMSEHYRKTQWFDRVCFICMVPCSTPINQ